MNPGDRLIEFVVDGKRYSLTYRDSDHSYWLSGPDRGRMRLVSCSTLSKVGYSDPSGLMHYSYKHGLAGTDYKEATKFTQECGNAAHAQLEALAQTGKALDLSGQPERVRGALQAVAKWWIEKEPTFVASEVIVCSPSMRYAGRFDFLAEVGGELVLGDLKTSDRDWNHFRRYKGAAAYAQLAGYSAALREMLPNQRQPTKRAILHVNTSGVYDWKPDLAPLSSEDAFQSKVRTYRLDQEWSKRYDAGVKKAAA